MAIKQTISLLFLLLLITSCGSRIGTGISSNSGNLLLEDYEPKKSGIGGYLGYGYQKMFDRHGVGADFEFGFRGYQTQCIECYEGTDALFHSLRAKYYYSLMESGASPYRLDLALGLGSGKFTLNSRDRYYPLVLSAGLDLYLTKNELVYLSTQVKYMNHLKSDEYNLGIEFGIGFYFKEEDGY